MKETNSNVLFSIKPKYINLILSGEKDYEYRNFYWDVEYPSWFTVYESSPIRSVKYFILLDSPHKKGQKICGNKSYGTERFNDGTMNSKYAYHILNIIDLHEPISLIDLKNIGLFPPQKFIYVDRNLELNNLISKEINALQK